MKYLKIIMMTHLVILLLLAGGNSMAADQLNTSKLTEIKAVKFNQNQVITAGLPTAEQFLLLQQAGVKNVINLIPNDNPNALKNEQKIVTDLGMQYHNINVDWQQPTLENVEQFFALMKANNNQPVVVHCAANYRASAFYYLYLATQQGKQVDINDTLSPWGDLQKSFEEYPQWQALIETVKQKYK
ncbi:protein tyrosine phosphatase family protein [Shewanella sp. OMA3-2]|uniref:protein tyrosine phosphatase family protein n=1 Tax=Shewanella sp. OMA3-2 TaxID=2908650 RepID=UPI001F1E2639|nr:protein tyrosine phosphatase family protein [Shewanella sp. OMA3-2]UJF22656.1 protein tyrosine phosphatase family protein [Shewanella sp. OMA3-2]